MTRILRLFTFLSILIMLAAACASAAPFTFIHISDTHITGSVNPARNLEAIVAEVNAMNPQPAFVLMTGDETETGLPRDWERYSGIISKFKMPVYNVAGNHETKWSHWGKFALHKVLNQEDHYSFSYGGVHFVAMDSTIWLQHHGTLDQNELTWLKKDLDKAGRNTPTILFYHHCPGFIPDEPELLRAIRPYNVPLILVGHGHRFRTWKRNGTIFQMVKGAMNDVGGYRILEVNESTIRSITKSVGSEPKPDIEIPLHAPANPITLLSPRANQTTEGDVHIRAMVGPAVQGRMFECSIDADSRPVTPDADGICDTTIKFEGTPGWHTVTVTAKDTDGMEWSDSALVRLNGKSREVWHAHVSGGVERGIRAAGDRLYFGTLGGDVYCLDARTGKEIWRRSLGSDVVSEVVVKGDYAYLGTTDGRIVGLDARTGEQKWEYLTGGPILASPAVIDGEILIGSGEPAYYALAAASGKLRWKYPMDRETQVVPVVLNGAVLFGAWDKNFYALDIKNGKERWKTPIGISFYFSTANSDPITDGERVIANVTPYKPEDADIYCLNARNGHILWSRRNPGKSDCGFNSPCIDGDRFYTVAGNGDVYCMSVADGKEIWHGSVGTLVVSGKPVAADGKVFISGLHGDVTCLDAGTGKSLWAYSTGEGYLFGGETVWQDLLIVPSMDGTVTALRR